MDASLYVMILKVVSLFKICICNDTTLHFQEYAEAGTVKQNYVNILLMLLRLRQACGHPLLVSSSSWISSTQLAKKLSYEKQMILLHCLETSLCGICHVRFSTRE